LKGVDSCCCSLSYERLLPELGIDDDVWRGAYELARKARSGGVSIPATHLLSAACAKRHDADLEHSDSDFVQLEQLELILELACN
jgi:predicted nucleic acid-binding protein